jgi:hypothetical protein
MTWVNEKGEYRRHALKPGRYRVTLRLFEERQGRERPTERKVPLGEVEIREGESTTFNAIVPLADPEAP